MADFCLWLRDTAFSQSLAESTWGVPILGALHVLAIAWFAGLVLLSSTSTDAAYARWRWAGVAMLLISGVLLFSANPVRLYQSRFLQLKLALLLAIGLNRWLVKRRPRLGHPVELTLWALVILASRGIAYY